MPLKFEAALTEIPISSSVRHVTLDSTSEANGSLHSIAAKPARKVRAKKQLADTAAGCRDRAAADLLAAAAESTRNGQLRLEASSASWGARAALLQRLDDSFEARIKAQQLMR